MGAYNTVETQQPCPFCGHEQRWTVQFKYGDCWQFRYRISDSISWGGNDYGPRLARVVRIGGIAEEPCESCGNPGIEAEIYLTEDQLSRVALRTDLLELGNEWAERVL